MYVRYLKCITGQPILVHASTGLRTRYNRCFPIGFFWQGEGSIAEEIAAYEVICHGSATVRRGVSLGTVWDVEVEECNSSCLHFKSYLGAASKIRNKTHADAYMY